MKGLHDAEENILSCLGSDHRLLYNLAATKKLASIKRLYDETLERLVCLEGASNGGDPLVFLLRSTLFGFLLQPNALSRY